VLSSIFTYYSGQVSAARVRLNELVVAVHPSSSPGGCCSCGGSTYGRWRRLAARETGTLWIFRTVLGNDRSPRTGVLDILFAETKLLLPTTGSRSVIGILWFLRNQLTNDYDIILTYMT